ncbi:hypothetical protein NNC19_02770 [Clostridium sp. SHJSY1]|uniref:TolB family protein n=1 Tax=Clostridium sp. SHJSY1 TaxID=2942483 RepID=UPI002876A55B|nr:hypothetical protein [Clostridium sp. SHJSY1]MDS0524585.1 hypothetical protein [Clostridium sp. SHJSY1]
MLKKGKGYLEIGLVCILILLSFMKILNIYKERLNRIEENPPNISGKMVYHTYSNYNDGDSQLYVFDFEKKENICISDKFKGVFNAMNGNFSSNGSEIVFMALKDRKEKDEWDIFIYNLETEKLTNLTKGNGLSDEDPKFSPDGKKIIFKQGHLDEAENKVDFNLVEMNLETEELKNLTDDIEEDSMPFYSANGESIYYARATGDKSSKICSINLGNENEIRNIYVENGVYCYYPTIYKDTLYFSKDYSTTNKSDVIVKMDLNTKEITIPDFNSSEYDCSDAYAISEQYIIISSTKPDGKGGYDLYIADVETGKLWSMNLFGHGINNEKHQLGASYYSKD